MSARGGGLDRPEPEILLEGGRLLNVFSGEILAANVLIGGGVILGVGDYRQAPTVHRLGGAFVLPGLIDGHVHIESSLLTPARFAEAVVPRGTTTVIADPHEIANVLGLDGVQWMLRATGELPLDVYLTAPSCVPASTHGTPGARLDSADVADMLGWERVLGLAEVMDFPGVVAGQADLGRKIGLARRLGQPIDGHAPGLTGAALDAYLAAGIETDHECVAPAEAQEKLRLGMRIMIREGSQARNLRDLTPVVNTVSVGRCLLVTDDRNAADLVNEGHLDHALREAIAADIPPLWAVQMATLNPASHFGLRHLGAVAPGRQADVVVVRDLARFECELVFKRGRLVAERGALRAELPSSPPLGQTMNVAPLTRDALAIRDVTGRIRVIDVVPGQLVTRQLIADPPVRDGEVVADPERDLAKLVVVERHRASGRVGRALLHGLGLRRGALVSSVAHDAHHLIGVGTDDADLLAAFRHVAAMGGGLAVVCDGEVTACLPLPVAGLMSDRPARETARALRDLEAQTERLGIRLPHPFGTLSFLALPVIPELRLTDHGLVDVTENRLVPLAAEP
jgi:adenine deaminase